MRRVTAADQQDDAGREFADGHTSTRLDAVPSRVIDGDAGSVLDGVAAVDLTCKR
jgi:hypothetical protein